MPRSIHRVDGPQAEIVVALRKAGIAVLPLNAVGGGVPDLLVSIRRYSALVEVKAPGGQLRESQKAFMDTWPGDVHVVSDPEEAVFKVIEGARHVFER